MLLPFLRQPNRAYRNFQIVYTVLTLQFLLPSLSYLFTPETALSQIDAGCALLGVRPLDTSEHGSGLWRMLSFSNVFALSFNCFLLQLDLRRFYPSLLPLVVLKGGSAVGSLWVWASTTQHPFFLFVVALDGVTACVIAFFAVRARRGLDGGDDAALLPRPLSARAAA
jgi:hypothetical protein